MTLREFLRQRLNRGPVSVPLAAHDAWSAHALTVDKIHEGYGLVRTELQVLVADRQAKYWPEQDIWTVTDGTDFEKAKAT